MTGRATTTVRRLGEEQRDFALTEIKALDSVQGIFEGYLAVFRNEDLNGDIIEPGAFKKTLSEAQERKTRDKKPYMYPLLWMHDVDRPIGAFDAQEDQHGLYVKGRCDLNIEQGRWAFSGMMQGYMSQLSIGYDTIKATRDQKGTRHLLETKLWEGSAVTTGYAANQDANILQTKSRAERIAAHKAVGAKTTWPLGDRASAWDGAGAHNRIVAWATNADDTLDEAKMKSVHFWYDSSAPDKITSYKLLFCDVKGGDVKAMPRGIMACTGAHGIQGVQGVSSGDMSSIKSKIATYYRRMAKEFDDETIVAPWDTEKRAWRTAIERKSWGGLQTVTRTLGVINFLSDEIDTMLEMLGDSCGIAFKDSDEGDVGAQISGAEHLMEVQPAVQILLDNMPGLKDALASLGTSFETFSSASADVLGLLGLPELDEFGAEMTVRPILELKRGARFSGANVATIHGICDGVEEHMTKLRNLVASTSADDIASVRQGASQQKLGTTEPGSRATTQRTTATEPDGEDLATLLESFREGAFIAQAEAAMRDMSPPELKG